VAGHSKWANIKHKKGKADAKRGKLFSRIMKEIISAVKQGGPDPKANPKLRLVIQKAKAANIPNDNIDKNIKKAVSPDTDDFVEVIYELYGHGGPGIIVEAMTDNKNRTASDMRIATNKRGGTIASPGSVMYNFDRKGIIQVPKVEAEEEDLFNLAIENGAENFDTSDDSYIVITGSTDLYAVKDAIDKAELKNEESLEMIPKTLVECSGEDLEKNMALIEWLEELDDVDSVYHNIDLP